MTQRRSAKRGTIIHTATALFGRHGYRAVGVDSISEASGVAKMTLYNHFASKNHLITEVLLERKRSAAESLITFVEAFDTPMARVEAIFLWHKAWFEDPAFNGCMFISAASEFPDHADEIHRVSAAQKRDTTMFFERVLSDLFEPAVAKRLAQQFLILVDGATVTALISGVPDAATHARDIARQLLRAACAEAGMPPVSAAA